MSHGCSAKTQGDLLSAENKYALRCVERLKSPERWNYKLRRSLLESCICNKSEQKSCVSLSLSSSVLGDFTGKLVLRGSHLLKSNPVNWDISAF